MYEVISPGVIVFKNISDKNYVDTIEKNISKYFELKINSSNGTIVRQSYSIQLSEIEEENDMAKQIYKNFIELFNETVNKYKDIYNISNMILENDGVKPIITILKYEIDDSIIYHTDTVGLDNRVGVILMYLNDNYSGGELEFKHLNLKIIPPKNSAVVFPSNWPYSHRSNSITSGTKYAVRCFLVSK